MGTVVTIMLAGSFTPVFGQALFLDITANQRDIIDAINELFEEHDQLAADVGTNRIAIDDLKLPHEFYILSIPFTIEPEEEKTVNARCVNVRDTTKAMSVERRNGQIGDLVTNEVMGDTNFILDAKNIGNQTITAALTIQCFKGDFIQVQP